jgi:hypothetical protein
MLKAIDSDVNIAVEKCLVFLANLASTYFTDDKWKSLTSTILHNKPNPQITPIYTPNNWCIEDWTKQAVYKVGRQLPRSVQSKVLD